MNETEGIAEMITQHLNQNCKSVPLAFSHCVAIGDCIAPLIHETMKARTFRMTADKVTEVAEVAVPWNIVAEAAHLFDEQGWKARAAQCRALIAGKGDTYCGIPCEGKPMVDPDDMLHGEIK